MKESSHRLRSLLTTTALTVLAVLPSGLARANPEGGNVVAGSATIATSDKTVDVTQQTDRAVIDWRSFNIGVDERTRFFQPNANSIIVNRVNDANPSSILGSLSANGNVVLINPNGVFFGKNAVVDVNGMLATTADIDNNAFMSGSNKFDKASSNTNAVIINNGQITAKEAGLIGLVAPNVINNGVINAKLGRVELASGDTVTVDFRGNGLTEIAVGDEVKQQLVKNTGSINAAGGTIAITAAAGKNIVNSLIDIKGELKAPAFAEHNGTISIFAAGSNKTNKSGSSHVTVQAKLDVSGKNANEHGGNVTIAGDHIDVQSGTTIDASGDTGGGNVLIGGDAHGQGITPTAITTTVEKDTFILTNALTSGDGGKTILWSDDSTIFAGNIEGRSTTGNGGFVETSGKQNLTTTGNVDLRGQNDSAGTWLLDPTNISIVNRSQTGTADQVNTISADYIETQSNTANVSITADNTLTLDLTTDTLTLANNRDITLTATSGSILSNSNGTIKTSGTGSIKLVAGTDISLTNNITFNAQGTGSVTFQANNNIVTTGGSNITTNGGAITINSDRDASGAGAINLGSGSNLTSNGGNITLGGGATPATVMAYGQSGMKDGILLTSLTINANGTSSGGNIIMNGAGWALSTVNTGSSFDAANGIMTNGATIQTNNVGTITSSSISGGTTGSGSSLGFYLYNSSVISAVNGDINITANQGTVGGGFLFSGAGTNKVQSTGSGNISITSNSGLSFSGATGGVFSTSGNVTLTTSYLGNNSGNGGVIGGNSATGTITIISSGSNIDYTTLLVKTTGSVVLKTPTSSTTTINIATGSGGLYLPTNFLNSITAGNITIGSNTGNGVMNVGAYTWAAPVTFITNNSSMNFTGSQTSAYNITAQITGAAYMSLASGITFQTSGAGSILLSGIGTSSYINDSATLNATGTGSVTLQFGGDVNVSGSITTQGGAIVLDSDYDANSIGAITVNTATLTSNGGNITLGGGATPTTGYAAGSQASHPNGIYLISTTINANGSAAGGNVILNGQGWLSSTVNVDAPSSANGLFFNGSTVQTNFLGSLTLNGIGGGTTGSNFNYGMYLYGGSTLTAVNGVTNINTTGGFGVSRQGLGVSGNGTNKIQSTGSGDINITATGNVGIGFGSAAGGIFSTAGNISLTSIGPIYNSGAGGTIGGNSATGTISLITDSTNFDYTTLAVKTTGSVVIKPYTAATILNVATGSGGLYLPTNFLNSITAGSITIGSSTIGNNALNVGAYTWAAPVTLQTNTGFINILGNQTLGANSLYVRTYGGSDINVTNAAITTSATGVAVTLKSGGGAVTTTGTSSINASAGTVTVQAGGNISLMSITATGVSVAASGAGSKITTGSIAVGTGGSITLTSDDVVIGGALSGTGTITLAPYNTGRNVYINYGTADGTNYNLSTAELAFLTDGWNLISIGDPVNATAGNINLGAATWNDSLFLNSKSKTLYGSQTFVGATTSFTSYSNGFNQNGYNITTAGGSVTLSNNYVPGSGGTITTNGGAFLQNAGQFAGGNLTINTSGGTITLNPFTEGTSSAGQTLTFNAGTGSVIFTNTVNVAADIVATGGTITSASVWGGTTGVGNVTLTATNSLTLPSITTAAGKTVTATVTGAGNKITTGAIATGTGGNITLTSDDVAINGALSGTGTLTLRPNAASRPVNINYGPNDGTDYNLSTAEVANLTDGWSLINIGRTDGSIDMNLGNIAFTDPLALINNYRISSNGNITLTGNASLNVTNAAGWFNVAGNITTNNQAVNISILGGYGGTIATSGGAVTVSNTLALKQQAGTLMTINTSGGNITINGISDGSVGSTTGRSVVFNAGTGAISFTGLMNTNAALTASGNTITSTNTWGGSIATGDITLTSVGNMSVAAITTAAGGNVTLNATGAGSKITTAAIATGAAGNITMTSDDVTIGGALSGTGVLTLQPYATSRYVNINNSTDNGTAYYLDTTELSKLTDGWNQINIGRTDSTGYLTSGASAWTDPVVFRGTLGGTIASGQTLSGTDNATVRFATQYLTIWGTLTTAGTAVTVDGPIFGWGTSGGIVNTNGGSFTAGSVQTNITSGSNNLTINTSGGNVTINGGTTEQTTSSAGKLLTINAGAGTVTLGGVNHTAMDVTVNAATITLGTNWANYGTLGNLTLTATNSITLPAIVTAAGKTASVTVTGAGNKITTSSIATGAAGSISLTSDDVTIGGALSGTGTLTLQENAITRAARFNFGTDDGSFYYLDTTEISRLTEGWSSIVIGNSGTTAGTYMGGMTFTDPVMFRTSGYRQIYTSGNLVGTDNASFNFQGGTSFDIFKDIVTAGGGLTVTTNLYSYGGNVSTNGGAITLGNTAIYNGTTDYSINSGNGNITVYSISTGGTTSAGKTLTVNAGTGTLNITGYSNTTANLVASAATITANTASTWSSTTGNITLTATNSIILPSITTAAGNSVNVTVTGAGNRITENGINVGAGGSITLTSDDVTLTGALTGTGTVTLQPYATTRAERINYSADDNSTYYLDATELTKLTDGWSLINIGRTDGGNTMDIGISTWTDPVKFRNNYRMQLGANITGTNEASLTFDAGAAGWINFNTSNLVLTTAGQNILFNSGTSANNTNGNTIINTNNGNVTFTGGTAINLTSAATASQSFTINAGTGTVILPAVNNSSTSYVLNLSVTANSITTGTIGSTNALGTVSLTAVNGMSLAAIKAATVNATVTGAGNSITTGAITTGTGGNITLTADDLVIGGTLSGTGSLVLKPYSTSRIVNVNNGTADGSNFNISTAEIGNMATGWSSITIGSSTNNGTFTSGANTWNSSVVYLSKNGDININGAQTMGANAFTATVSGTGNIVFNSGSITTTATGNAITLTSGGSINSTSVLSAANGIITLTSVGNLTIAPTTSAGLIATVSGAGNSITAGAISVGAGNISLTADDVILNGALTGTGTLTMQPYATTRTMDINFGPNDGTDFNISTAEIGQLTDGWSMINLGRIDGNTPYEINTSTWTDPVTFRNSNRRDIAGPLTGTNEASFTFLNGWDSISSNVTTAGQAITYTNATVYGGNGTITSNGGAINIFQIGVYNGNSGTNINSGNGNITIGSIVEVGTSSAGRTQNINAGTGTLNITGTVNGAMNVTGSAATITLGGIWGGTTALGTVSLTATNSMTLPAISASSVTATVTGAGNRITTGAITTGTGGNITLTSDDMTIGGALSGTGTVTLQSYTSTKGINVNDTTNGMTDNGTYLFFDQNEINRLSTGWGQVNIGNTSNSGISFLGTATFTNPFNFKQIGTTYLDGTITGTGNASIAISGQLYGRDGTITTAGQNITVAGVTFERGGSFTTNGGNFIDNGVFRMVNTYNNLNAVNVSTSGGSITISSNLNEVGSGGSIVGKNIILNAGTGIVSFGSTANGTYNVSVTGSGITFNGAWGATTGFGNVSLTSVNALTLPSITTAAGGTVNVTVTGAGNKITTSTIATGAAGNITLQSDDLVVGGALSGTGTITLQPNSTTRITDVATGANDGTDWNLSTAEIANLTDGWSLINIGRIDTTVGLNLATTSWSDPVHFRNNSPNLFAINGNITGTDNASLTFDANGNSIYPNNSGQTIQTNNQNITFNGVIRKASTSTIINTATFNAGTGTIAFNGGISNGASGYALNIVATAGTITFGGAAGGTAYPLGTLTLTAVNSITLPTVYASNVNVTVTGAGNKITTGAITTGTGGNITLTSDDVTIGGAVSGTGTLTLQQANSSRTININIGADDGTKYYLDTTELSRLTDGWSSVLLGNSTYGGDISIGASAWTDPVTFRSANYRGVSGNITGTGDASFTFSGGISVNMIGNITTAGGAVTFGTNVVSYAYGGSITTNGGAVNLYLISTYNGIGNFIVNSGGGNITDTNGITNSGGTTAAGKTVTLNAGTGNVIASGGVQTAADVSLTGSTVTLTGAWGSTTPLGNVTLSAVNSLTLPAITTAAGKTVSVTASGAGSKITTSTITTGTGGNITLTSDDITIGGNLSGTGTVTLQPYSTTRQIAINIGTDDGTKFYLDSTEIAKLVDGWAQINVGLSTTTLDYYINNTAWTDPVNFRGRNMNISGTFNATDNASVVFTSTISTGIGTNAVVNTNGNSLTFNGILSGWATNGVINTGGGNVTITGSTTAYSAGANLTINTAGGNITGTVIYDGAGGVGKSLVMNAGTGTVSFSGTTNTGADITISAATITLTGAVGGTTPTGNLSLTATNNLTLPSITTAAGKTVTATVTGAGNKITTGAITTGTAGNITLTSDDVTIGGNLSGTGTLMLQQNSTTRAARINYSTDDGTAYYLDTTEISKLVDGWSSIIIGNATNTAAMNIGASTWTDPTTFRTNGYKGINNDINGTDNASFTFLTTATNSVDVNHNITTAGGAVTFGTNINAIAGNGIITTNGGAVSTYNFATFNGTGGLTVNTSGGNITVTNGMFTSGTTAAGKVINLNAGTGNVSIANSVSGDYDLVVSGATITAGGAWNSGTALGSITLTATNSITLPAIATAAGKTVSVTVTGAGNKITTSVIGTGAGGNITLTSDDVTIGGALSGTGTLTLQQNSLTRVMRINNGTDDGSYYYLDTAEMGRLTDGWSQINFSRADSTADLYTYTMTVTDPVSFLNGGAKHIFGNLTATGNASVTFANAAGSFTELGGALTTAGQAVSFSNTMVAYAGAIINTNGGNFSGKAISVADNLSINTAGGSIAVNGTIVNQGSATGQETKTVTLNAGTGALSITGNVTTTAAIVGTASTITTNTSGNYNGIGNLTLMATNSIVLPTTITTAAGKTVSVTVTGAGNKITTGAIATGAAGNITLTSDDVTIGGTLSGTGTITLQPNSLTRNLNVNYGTDDGSSYYLDTAEIAKLNDGWSQIRLNTASNTTALTNMGVSTWTDPVAILNNLKYVYGALTGTDNASFAFSGNTNYILNSITTNGGNVTITGNMILNAGTASITTNGGSFSNTNTTSVWTAGNGLTVNTSGGNITFSALAQVGSVAGKSVVLNAGTGTVTFGGAVDGGYDLTASGATITTSSAWGSTNALGNITLTAVNNLTLPAITTAAGKTVTATVTGAGNKITTGAIATGAAGNITLTSDDVAIGGALSGTGAITLQANALSRTINVNYGTDDGSSYYLDTTEVGRLTDGWNQINIGKATSTAALNSGAVTFTDPTAFYSNNGVVTRGTLTGSGNASFAFSGGVGGANFYSDITTAGGNISTSGSNYVYTTVAGSTITTNGGNVLFSTGVTIGALTGGLTVNTSGGNITLSTVLYTNTSSAGKNITLNAGTGNVSIGGVISGTANIIATGNTITLSSAIGSSSIPLGALTLTALNNLVLPSTVYASNVTATVTGAGNKITTGAITTGTGGIITLISDDVAINGALSGTGTITLQPYATTRTTDVNYGANDGTDWNLSTAEIANLADGWSSIVIGNASNSSANLEIGASTWTDPVTFRSNFRKQLEGSIVGTGNASITFSGNSSSWLNINSGSNMTTNGGNISFVGGMTLNTTSGNITTNGGNLSFGGSAYILQSSVFSTSGGNITFANNLKENTSTVGKTLTLDAGTGTVSFGSTVNLAGNLIINASTITSTGAWGNTITLGNVSLTSANNISLPTINAASVLVKTTGASAGITATGQITTTATGDALILAGQKFTNTFGATALNVTNGGRFLVWSADPSADSRNGVSYAFKQYNAVYGTTTVAGSGSGFLYLIAPTVSVTLQNVNKVYDGTNVATLTGANYLGSSIDGDTLAFSSTGATYNDKNVGNNKNVTANGISVTASNGGATVYGYQYNTSVTSAAGNVSAANLTITANDKIKTYGSTVTFNGNEYTQSGLFSGDAISGISLASTGASATANASMTPYAIAGSAATGTGLTNYNITYVDGNMVVLQKALTITASDSNKTYGDIKTFAGTEFTTNGLVNSDAVTSVTLASAGTVATATVASGPYTITDSNAVGTGLSNYSITYVGGHLTIDKANLTVTANNGTKTYGDNVTYTGNEFTTSGLKNTDTATSATITSTGAGAMANASVTPYDIIASNVTGTGLDNYNISYANGGLTVNKANLTVTANSGTKTYGDVVTYNGSEYTQSGLLNGDTISGLTIVSSGAAATANASVTPYAVTAMNASGARLSNYNVSYVDGGLTVNKANLTVTANSGNKTYGDTLTYTGTEFTTVGLKNSDMVNTAMITSAGAAATAIVTGTPYDVVISNASGTGLSNYNVSYVNGGLTLGQASLTIVAQNQVKEYGDIVNFNGTEFISSGLKNSDNITSVALASSGALAGATVAGGPYAITIGSASGNGLGNYSITYVNGTFAVNQAGLTIVAQNQVKQYGDSTTFNGSEYVSSGLRNGDTISSVVLSSAGAAATATVMGSPYAINISDAAGSGLENYAITYVNGTYAINKASLTVTSNSSIKTYGDTVVYNGTQFTASGLKNSDTVTSATITSAGAAATANANATPYDVAISNAAGTGLSNYTITYVDGGLTVNKANLSVTANDKVKTYGNTVNFAGNEFTVSGLLNSDHVNNVTITSSGAAATANASMTPYAVIASNAAGIGLSNYNISYTDGNMVVLQKALTITANDTTKDYGVALTIANNAFTANGLVNSDSISGVTLVPSGAIATANVSGSPYAITASNAVGTGLSNYNVTYVGGHLTVNPIALTVTASNQTKTYGQTTTFNGTEFSSIGLINGDHINAISLMSSGAAASANASGTPYSIVGSNAAGTGLSNYVISYVDGGLTINKANLTVAANDLNKTYGTTLVFTGNEYTAVGLVNNDHITDLNLSSAGTIATAEVANGPYTINASNAVGTGLSNYNITYVGGTLNIAKADLNISAKNYTKQYLNSLGLSGYHFLISGLQNSDTVTHVDLASAGAANTAPYGLYTVTVGNAIGTGLDNYNIIYHNGTITIPAPATTPSSGTGNVSNVPQTVESTSQSIQNVIAYKPVVIAKDPTSVQQSLVNINVALTSIQSKDSNVVTVMNNLVEIDPALINEINSDPFSKGE